MDFKDWMDDLVVCLMKDGGMGPAQAKDYAADQEAWRGYYDDGYLPDDAVSEDMSYWGE